MSRPFELRVDRVEGACVLSVLGELDIGTAPHFRRGVGGLLGSPEGHRLVVDLTETDFLDSSGVAALVWALFRVRATGGEMVAVNDDGVILGTIALACLDDLIPLEATCGDALARVAREALTSAGT